MLVPLLFTQHLYQQKKEVIVLFICMHRKRQYKCVGLSANAHVVKCRLKEPDGCDFRGCLLHETSLPRLGMIEDSGIKDSTSNIQRNKKLL